MLVLGLPNSRMKDYFDIWTLCRTMDFDGTTLASAVTETIKRRQTTVPDGTPTGISASFGTDAMKQAQWAAFLRKMGMVDAPDLPTVVAKLHEFLMPLVSAARTGKAAHDRWPAGGPWR
jgi:hypothetical protein